MKLLMHAALLAATVLYASAAPAQSRQTAASAQAFLQMTVEKSGATLSWFHAGSTEWNTGQFEGKPIVSEPDPVMSITPRSDCISVIRYDDRYELVSIKPNVYKHRTIDKIIDWDKIPTVKRVGAGV